LSGRTRLVGPHRRTMNNNQSDGSHNASPFYPIAQLTVPSAVTNAVSAATIIFTAISTNRFFINFSIAE
ncbi:MAG: hypothetical protein VZR09_11435, partial [Candidatus Gastranaerophilaceae bacterium]|nr:hypothetical protein [Candidatus Gastranaerophilaceae bacterium]